MYHIQYIHKYMLEDFIRIDHLSVLYCLFFANNSSNTQLYNYF